MGRHIINPEKFKALEEIGQSLWLDHIDRPLINSGRLQDYIDAGLLGLTSNPSIFKQAIAGGHEYDDDILRYKRDGRDTFGIYDALSVTDIQQAADEFMPVYERTQGRDGYVSLEIDPRLAHDEAASIREGRRLFEAVARPNCMIKVPATEAGYTVIEELLSEGIHVNVTLIFSPDQYARTLRAFVAGQRRRLNNTDPTPAYSVASVFVSRIDTAVDRWLSENAPADAAGSLKGRAAVANSRIIYDQYKRFFEEGDGRAVLEAGSPRQRVLWGSTSTKNPAYSDVKYVEELIAEGTVNTVPESTLSAFLDHGRCEPRLEFFDLGEANRIIRALGEAGLDLNTVYASLLADGLKSFVNSFEQLLAAIEQRAQSALTSP